MKKPFFVFEAKYINDLRVTIPSETVTFIIKKRRDSFSLDKGAMLNMQNVKLIIKLIITLLGLYVIFNDNQHTAFILFISITIGYIIFESIFDLKNNNRS